VTVGTGPLSRDEFLKWLAAQIVGLESVESVQVSYTQSDILVSFNDYSFEELEVSISGLDNAIE
jgi:hypothetical protein